MSEFLTVLTDPWRRPNRPLLFPRARRPAGSGLCQREQWSTRLGIPYAFASELHSALYQLCFVPCRSGPLRTQGQLCVKSQIRDGGVFAVCLSSKGQGVPDPAIRVLGKIDATLACRVQNILLVNTQNSYEWSGDYPSLIPNGRIGRHSPGRNVNVLGDKERQLFGGLSARTIHQQIRTGLFRL